jgi:RND family efflux transporter MFP subunit
MTPVRVSSAEQRAASVSLAETAFSPWSVADEPTAMARDLVQHHTGARTLSLILCLCLGIAANAVAAETPATAPGITESFLEVALSSSVAGIITTGKYHEGDFVNEGTPVVELDKKLEELEVERRKLVVNVRKRDFEATEKLFTKTKGTSKEELEKKEADYRIAAVDYETAVEQLRKRHIFAPFPGHITEILLHPGEACQPYQPVIRMVDTRRCYFVSDVEARTAALLKTNQTVRLILDTGGEPVTLDGKITFLSPVADPASGLVKVKALFENPTGRIRPGLAGGMMLPERSNQGAP